MKNGNGKYVHLSTAVCNGLKKTCSSNEYDEIVQNIICSGERKSTNDENTAVAIYIILLLL